jgi:hypothetical protein
MFIADDFKAINKALRKLEGEGWWQPRKLEFPIQDIKQVVEQLTLELTRPVSKA